MSSYYRQQLEEWLSRIEVESDSVLDVGGGANPVNKRVRLWNVKDYEVLDSGHEDEQVEVNYVKDLNIAINLGKKFDAVFCLEVFEYIYDPVTAVGNLYNFLNDDGVLYLSVPTIYPVHNPIGIDYLRFTKFGIERLLDEAGFASWEITPRIATAGIELLRSFYAVEQMHPIKDKMVLDIGYMIKAWKN